MWSAKAQYSTLAAAALALAGPGTALAQAQFTTNATTLNGIPEGRHIRGAARLLDLDGRTGIAHHNRELLHREQDLVVPGRVLSIVFSRNYRSQGNYDGELGANWAHSFDYRLSSAGQGDVDLFDPQAMQLQEYRSTGTGGLLDCVTPGVYRKAKQQPDGTWKVRDRHGMIYSLHGLNHPTTPGRLIAMEDSSGNRIQAVYDDSGRLSSLLGDSYDAAQSPTRRVDFEYVGGRITRVIDVHGTRDWLYEYDSDGNLERVRTPIVESWESDSPVVGRRETHYGYSKASSGEEVGNLETITYPGHGLPLWTALYDGADHVEKLFLRTEDSSPAGSYRWSSQASTGVPGALSQTEVTHPRGGVYSMHFNSMGCALLETDPTGEDAVVGYNGDGEVTLRVMREGNQEVLTYASSTTADRFQHGNQLTSLHVPANGKPGTQASYAVDQPYEPVFNTALPTVTQDRTLIFDYQEDPASVAALVSEWGIDYVAPAGLGDVNGDGATDQSGGWIIEERGALVSEGLPPGQTTPQRTVDTWTRDAFGRVTSLADGEGSLTTYEYAGDRMVRRIEDADPAKAAVLNSGVSRWSKPDDLAHVEAEWEFGYNSRGQRVSQIDPRGVVSTAQYSALGELTAAKQAESSSSTRLNAGLSALIAAGYPHLVERAVGQEIRYGSDGAARQVIIDNGGGGDPSWDSRVVEFEFDLMGRMRQLSEARPQGGGSVAIYEYDSEGNLTFEQTPDGVRTHFIYDLQGRKLEERQGCLPDGSVAAHTEVLTFEYDFDGKLVRTEGPADLDGDGALEARLREYDGRGRLHRTVDSVGTELRYAYGPKGWVSEVETYGQLGGPSPTGNNTTGNMLLGVQSFLRTVNGDIYERRRSVFDLGQPATTAFQREFTARDANRDRIHVVDEDDGFTATQRDGLGRVVRVEDETGSWSEYDYDKVGNLLERRQFIQGSGAGGLLTRTEQWLYDGMGNLVRSISGKEVTYFNYSESSRTVVQANGRSDVVGADPLGLYSAEPIGRAGDGKRWVLEDHSQGTLVKSFHDMHLGTPAAALWDPWAAGFDPAQAHPGAQSAEETQVLYDDAGRVMRVTSPRGLDVNYAYDELGRLSRKDLPNGTSHEFEYLAGNLVSTQRLLEAGGQIYRQLDFAYDANGRILTVSVAQDGGAVGATTAKSYEWNGLDLVVAASDDKSSSNWEDSLVEYAYDSLGRVLEETQNGLTVHSEFDALGRTKISYPGGLQIDQDRDLAGRLRSLSDPVSGTVFADYDYYGSTHALEALSLGNGMTQSYRKPALGSSMSAGYSSAGRPELMEYLTSSGSLLAAEGAQFGANGRRELRLRTLGASVFGDVLSTDSRGRTASHHQVLESAGQVLTLFGRDADGGLANRTVSDLNGSVSSYGFSTASDGWATEGIGSLSLDHDPAGNRIRDEWFDYEFDAWDRLVQVRDRYNSVSVARYSYDTGVRRVKIEDWTGREELLVHDGYQLLEVRDAQGTLLEEFVNGAWIDDVVYWRKSGESGYYFQTDTLGSVVGLFDESGALAERVSYDFFGAPTFLNADGTLAIQLDGVPYAASPLGNRLLFQSRPYDAELAKWRRAQDTPGYFANAAASGQYNFRYRYMSPEEGRFVSRDPLSHAGNNNIDPVILVGRLLAGESATPYELLSGASLDESDPLGLSYVVFNGITSGTCTAGAASGQGSGSGQGTGSGLPNAPGGGGGSQSPPTGSPAPEAGGSSVPPAGSWQSPGGYKGVSSLPSAPGLPKWATTGLKPLKGKNKAVDAVLTYHKFRTIPGYYKWKFRYLGYTGIVGDLVASAITFPTIEGGAMGGGDLTISQTVAQFLFTCFQTATWHIGFIFEDAYARIEDPTGLPQGSPRGRGDASARLWEQYKHLREIRDAGQRLEDAGKVGRTFVETEIGPVMNRLSAYAKEKSCAAFWEGNDVYEGIPLVDCSKQREEARNSIIELPGTGVDQLTPLGIPGGEQGFRFDPEARSTECQDALAFLERRDRQHRQSTLLQGAWLALVQGTFLGALLLRR